MVALLNAPITSDYVEKYSSPVNDYCIQNDFILKMPLFF